MTASLQEVHLNLSADTSCIVYTTCRPLMTGISVRQIKCKFREPPLVGEAFWLIGRHSLQNRAPFSLVITSLSLQSNHTVCFVNQRNLSGNWTE